MGSHPPHPFSYVTVAPSGNDAIQPFFGLLKINKKKKTIVASNNVALWSKFYDESVCRNVIIPDAILLLQNEIFKDKKQNSNGIWTTLTITSFFLVFCLIPFVTNTTFITSLSSQVYVFKTSCRLWKCRVENYGARESAIIFSNFMLHFICVGLKFLFAKFALHWTKIKEIKKEVSNGYLKEGQT